MHTPPVLTSLMHGGVYSTNVAHVTRVGASRFASSSREMSESPVPSTQTQFLELNSTYLLDSAIDKPLEIPTKLGIITRLWKHSFGLSGRGLGSTQFQYNEPKFRPYLSYYANECLRHARSHSTKGLIVNTHGQILDTIDIIRENQSRTRRELKEILLEKLDYFAERSEEQINLCLAFCVRLWLMINVRDVTDPTTVMGSIVIYWEDGMSLDGLLQSCLLHQLPSSNNPVILSQQFTARNLERFARITLRPTASLADHLQLHPQYNPPRVDVFHYSSFLKAQLELKPPPLDLAFLEETMKTLTLLFPGWDLKSTQHLVQLQKDLQLDPALTQNHFDTPISRVLSDYKFYGSRLDLLNSGFESGKSANIRQLFWDRRNKQQWYTLWIAVAVFILTVFFGIIQSVTGIMQVYASFRSIPSGELYLGDVLRATQY
jgi:hypothetical protein